MGQRNDPLVLVQRLDTAFRELEGIAELPNLLTFREHVAALYVEAKAHGARELRFRAAALKLNTERRLGELLIALRLHGGDRRSSNWSSHATLADWGLSRSTASRAYALAAIPIAQFRACIEHQIAQGCEPTQRSLLEIPSQLHGKSRKGDHLQAIQRLREVTGPDGQRYSTILLTPCWRRESCGPRDRQLPPIGLTWQEVVQIPVPELAAQDAHLYIWVDMGDPQNGASVYGRWGFRFRGYMCHRTNLGRYCDWCHDEVSLTIVASRGELAFRGNDQPNWREVVFHKDRPTDDQLQETVESFSPPPYLHIFGTSSRPNWSSVPVPTPRTRARST